MSNNHKKMKEITFMQMNCNFCAFLRPSKNDSLLSRQIKISITVFSVIAMWLKV